MRDEHYRGYCEFEREYDLVINAIKSSNRYAVDMPESEREEFACKVVNDCIRTVIFGDCGMFCSTGNCLAVRVSSRPELPGFTKVILAVRV